ncbi:hypothetical protein SPSIL_012580 [Sporomusa silvacetica DSM 10669]|uniref:PIN domain-containing protein n=1 Tax=Sporomusa silvacetica DSM 10669 TaxID=1123289 RepID=A0ABZ3IHJ2_9FIRM|nr:PIN domain-containing protein [Sporomusa silvacetica]OZC17448.1 hypothetical protein SPSIL_32590 [Sporomusa silvacetica DSM 10669]
MQSVIQYINTEVLSLKKQLNNLMEYSDIIRWNYSKIIMSGAGDYEWEELNDNGRKIQEQLLNDYKRFINLFRFLSTDLPNTQQNVLDISVQKVFNIIEQNGFLFKMNKEEEFNNAMKAIDLQLHLIAASYEVTDEYCLLIPDSNALVANPEIEKWNFEEIDRFKIVVLPIVANELDKVTTNNEQMQNKIKNKIIEYAKLGNIFEGVKINEQNIIKFAGSLQKTENPLAWLDINNNYDQVIASYFEIVRANPHTQVILITDNPILQAKALLANVAHIEPPVLKIDRKPATSTPSDSKPDVEQLNTMPANSKPAAKVMPKNSESDNKPVKVTIPPAIINPAGIRPTPKPKAPKPKPPKPRTKSKPNLDIFKPKR